MRGPLKGLGGVRSPPGGLGGVRIPPRRAGRGEEALPGDREESQSPSGNLGGVRRNQDSPRRARIIGSPSRTAERGRESLPQGREGLVCPPRGPLGVRSPFLVGREGFEGPSYGIVGAGRGREALPERP